MDELANPFRPGAGTAPPALLGRDGLIDAFGVALRRAVAGKPGKSLMPRGLRGVGKTVLLNRFMAVAEQERVVVSFLEAPESQDFRVLLAGRLRRVLLGLERSGVSSAVHRALKVLKSFSYQLCDGSSVTLDVTSEAGQADSGVLVDDVTDLLVAVGEAMRDRTLRSAAGCR